MYSSLLLTLLVACSVAVNLSFAFTSSFVRPTRKCVRSSKLTSNSPFYESLEFFEEENDQSNMIQPEFQILEPDAELQPEDIGPLLMKALREDESTGLSSIWNFSAASERGLYEYDEEKFRAYAQYIAVKAPASFYGMARSGNRYEFAPLKRVGGENGWIASHIMTAVSEDGRTRRYQWMLMKNRRPPQLGCWLIEAIGASDQNGNFSVDNGV